VVSLDADARSILSLYKALIDLRKRLPQLMSGDYLPIAAEGDLLLYRRQSEEGVVVIALNLGAEPVSIASEAIGLVGEILLSTSLDRQDEKIRSVLDLRGNEGVIIGV
jgi:alpha-glucosidase